MKKNFLLYNFVFLFFCFVSKNSTGQCSLIDSINSLRGYNNLSGIGTFSDYICSGTDSVGTIPGNGYFDGDAYFISLVGGSSVTFSVDSCLGNPVSLTLTDSLNNIIPGAYSSPACPNSLDFSVPYTGSFILVLNKNGICGGGGTTFLGNAQVRIQSGTTVPSCPVANVVNDTICGAVELMIDSAYVTGNTSLASLTDPIDSYIASIGCTCSVPNNTLWYSFHAAVNMNKVFIRLKTDSSSTFYSWLNVFIAGNITSTCTGNLIFLGCETGPNSPIGIDSLEIPLYGVQAGSVYYFMIDGYSGATGEISIAIASDTVASIVDEFAEFSELTLFPNPAKKFINIYSKTEISKVTLTLFNIYGQEVYHSYYSTLKNENIDLNIFTPGVYFLRLYGSSGLYEKKIIIE